jgi:hypothetical protein
MESQLPVFRSVAGHHAPVPFLLTRDMFGGIPVELGGAEITALVGRPVAEPHVHDVPEIYLLFSPEPGGAEIDVEVEDESFRLTAPAALFVPAGRRHRFVTRSAVPGSYCYGLFLHASPEQSQTPAHAHGSQDRSEAHGDH